ncbi:MAG: metallophosphoesterase [Candidatus Hydrogenedentota bacterium]
MRILFIGDIVGNPGRASVHRWLGPLKEEFRIDFVMANAENAAGGVGATPAIVRELFNAGISAITMGNHTWRKRELLGAIDSLGPIARPANYPPEVPGMGSHLVVLPDGRKVGIVNLIGRVYMEAFDCPFTVGLREVDRLRDETPLVIVDMHAEATSEKVAMGWFLDGKCTAVLGTHTHVQTADERVLPHGTAYITDVGMTGPFDSVIGVERETVIQKFLTGIPAEFKVAKDRPGISAVVIDADESTGRSNSITRIMRFD